ncbi:MAG: DNA alkylation repair protein [Sphaerochaetaceae bacterium]
MKSIETKLFEYKDEKYKVFTAKLNPAVNLDKIIGIRLPNLRKIAKGLSPEEKEYILNNTPHKYLEENFLHSFIISSFKDWNQALEATNLFLPLIDNWAVCDTFDPKIFISRPKEFEKIIKNAYLKSENTYTIRFATVMLMRYFLEDNFSIEHFIWLNDVKNDDYYVKMAISWYYSTALIKQWDKTIIIFENKNLESKWIHNKSIQKAIESFRISKEKKDYLRSLKIK